MGAQLQTLRLQEDAKRLSHYRYLEIQMMELMGGWAQSIVEPEVKIAFGRQMYQDAVHADLIGKRLPELKARSARYAALAPSDAFVRVMEEVWQAAETPIRLVGLYRVLKPHLAQALREHLSRTGLPEDEPTAHILRNIAEEEEDHIAWGSAVIDKILDTKEKKDNASKWKVGLEQRLKACGGVTGEGQGSGTYTFKKELGYSKHPVRDSQWQISENADTYTEKNWSYDDAEGRMHLLHDLLNSEFITVERMGRILSDFPDLPWPMRMDMARQAWDEARHAEIIQRRLEEVGGSAGMYPINFWGWEMDVNRPDPLERLALSNATFESESCKHLRDWIKKAKKIGDEASVQVLEYVLADEVNHVQYGIHWIDELTKLDPERRKRVLEYPKKLLETQHPVGVKFEETVNVKKTTNR